MNPGELLEPALKTDRVIQQVITSFDRTLDPGG
jgi:hypothetical protein